MTDTTEFDVHYDGGTEQERADVLEAFQAFWRANNTLDIPALRKIWLDRDDTVYFNSNGFTYNGFQDWLGIWRYYGPRFRLVKEATLGDVHVIIRGEMAVVMDGAVDRLFEVTSDDVDGPPIASHPVMRATMVFLRTEGKWMCVHAHYSPAAIEGERPWAPEGADASS